MAINAWPCWKTGALIALLTAAPAVAQAPNTWQSNGAEARGPNLASSGEFGVMQVATTEPERLMADWLKPAEGAPLYPATRAHKGQPIVTFIIFSGCRADASGNCNVTADFETIGPSGAVYDRTAALKVWVGRPAPAGRRLQLSEDALGLRFEPKDAPGAYTVRATITDHVSNVTLRTSQVLTAEN